MDFAQYDTVAGSNAGAEMTVMHPANFTPIIDEKTGEASTVTLAGIDSDAFRARQRELYNKNMNSPRAKMSMDEAQYEADKTLVACVLGWKHIVLEGKELECNPKNVEMMFKRFPWFRDQIDRFVADRANFLKG